MLMLESSIYDTVYNDRERDERKADTMGFFQGLGRVIAGKPVFQTTSDPVAPEQPHDAPRRFVDESGRKIIPEIKLTHTKSHIAGESMTVSAWATNQSSEHVRLDYMTLLGQKHTISQELAPGKGSEIKLYNGPVARDDHASRAELVYRLFENGDVFSMTYTIEFNRESNGYYIVEEFHSNNPVRDI